MTILMHIPSMGKDIKRPVPNRWNFHLTCLSDLSSNYMSSNVWTFSHFIYSSDLLKYGIKYIYEMSTYNMKSLDINNSKFNEIYSKLCYDQIQWLRRQRKYLSLEKKRTK